MWIMRGPFSVPPHSTGTKLRLVKYSEFPGFHGMSCPLCAETRKAEEMRGRLFLQVSTETLDREPVVEETIFFAQRLYVHAYIYIYMLPPLQKPTTSFSSVS